MVFDERIETLQREIEYTKDMYSRTRQKSTTEELYYQKIQLLNKELKDIQKKED